MDVYVEKNTLKSGRQYIAYAIENGKSQYDSVRSILGGYASQNKIVFEGKYNNLLSIRDIAREDRYASFIFTYNESKIIDTILTECKKVTQKLKLYDLSGKIVHTKEY